MVFSTVRVQLMGMFPAVVAHRIVQGQRLATEIRISKCEYQNWPANQWSVSCDLRPNRFVLVSMKSMLRLNHSKPTEMYSTAQSTC